MVVVCSVMRGPEKGPVLKGENVLGIYLENGIIPNVGIYHSGASFRKVVT